MFGLFKNKPSVKIADKVWISEQAKWNACRAMHQLDSHVIFIAWFPDTLKALRHQLLSSESAQIFLAEDVTTDTIAGKTPVFIEHYPLAEKEEALFKKLGLQEVNIVSSMDEPFFEKFGGERTIEIMRKLGIDENEAIGNDMVHRAIRNAQEKLAKSIVVEKLATSQKEWMNLNASDK